MKPASRIDDNAAFGVRRYKPTNIIYHTISTHSTPPHTSRYHLTDTQTHTSIFIYGIYITSPNPNKQRYKKSTHKTPKEVMFKTPSSTPPVIFFSPKKSTFPTPPPNHLAPRNLNQIKKHQIGYPPLHLSITHKGIVHASLARSIKK